MKKPTIIYISGYGRSGSTLLSLLLNIVPDFANVGEIDYLFREDKLELPEFWKSLKTEILSNVSKPETAVTKVSSLINYFIKRNESSVFFKELWQPTLESVAAHFKATTLIDASKSTFGSFSRPVYLKNAGYSVKVVHLVRNPHGVVSSYKKGSNLSNSEQLAPAKRGGALRGLINWFITNVCTTFVYKKWFDKDEYFVLSYDALINDYENQIVKLFEFLDKSLPNSLLQEDILLSKDPSFSGNRLRLKKSLKIQKKIEPDEQGFIGFFVTLLHNIYKKIEPNYGSQL